MNVTKLYANTFCKCSSESTSYLHLRAQMFIQVAMLNGRDRINQQRGIGGVSGYPSNINFGSRETKSKMSVSHSGSHEREDDIEVSFRKD